ncbi:MAG: polyprenyl synthetase family protein [Acidobacteriota bacterium]
MSDVPAFLTESARRIDAVLDQLLPPAGEGAGRLHEAMRYSTLAPGKRLRPALALASCRLFAGDETLCLEPAAALEMIHAYSLIHDDLPAMDDDDLRRGQPTSHVVFGEAMAILAGDALHSLACETMAFHPGGPEHARLRSRVQRHVLGAIGWQGMVGGQVLDLSLTGRGGQASEGEVEEVHLRKTGALIRASLVVGAEVGGATPEQVEAVGELGKVSGLAFQVVDDVLDVTSHADELGKTGGKDEAANKVTYPAVLGLEGAREKATELTRDALARLEAVSSEASGDGGPLAELLRFVLERRS